MGNVMRKVSRAGLVMVILGVFLLGISLGDTVTSFKAPKSFEDILETGVEPGDHVSGEVIFLLDTFASMQTWTENTSTHSTTPKKTSAQYYVLPAGEGYAGLTVHSQDFGEANKLVEQTYACILENGEAPTAELSLDARVTVMEDDLAAMFREDLRDYYGFTEQDISALGTPLMVEPRAFTTIRIFCAVGAGVCLAGVLMLVMHWRKVSAQIRRAREEMPGPDLD